MKKNKAYTIGLDYGTDSVRCIIVDVSNGKTVSTDVFYYPRWKQGKYCVPAKNQFRQHPLDYLEGLEKTIRGALRKAPAGTAARVVGISVDTTGSTPVAVDKNGTPLALLKGFANNPNAMFILWKDHTAIKEAAEINHLAHQWEIDYTKYVGGIYSSEWFWAKILHVLRTDPAVRDAAFSWVEHCDWIPAVLTGNTHPLTLKRSRCAAGHKAMWNEEFGGLPSEKFLSTLDPLLSGLRERLYTHTCTCDVKAGNLSREWAKKLGLPEGIAVGTGAFDAHLGAVGGEIQPHQLLRVMGTSTCDMMVAPMDEMKGKLIRGICGQVDGSIIPGMLGMEAGQSAFGDVYAWFARMIMQPSLDIIQSTRTIPAASKKKIREQLEELMIPVLSRLASKIPAGETDIVALDWLNGRRTPDANQMLKGAIAGLNLGTDAAAIFKALVEATAFGSRKIFDRFVEEGISIDNVVAIGGVAKKSPYVMQVLADVLNVPIKVARSDQACALGAAMAAAVVAGVYSTIPEAQKNMGNGFEKTYSPNPSHHEKYQKLYQKYSSLGHFIEQQTHSSE